MLAGIIRGMKTNEAIKHFGSQVRLGEVLEISQASVSKWGEFPPDSRQLQIERITVGALKAEPGCLDRVIGFKQAA